MPLASGTSVGGYEVIALLGAGGMGEVYRARDSRLQRDVALKILPDHFVSDPERLARFQREAQVLASLAHANIAHIYAIEDGPEGGGSRALVLELVEGPTLADRIAQGPIPIDEALAIAKQIADALDAAHESGIVHRDLKPANVKLREDGTVKVLDFGLAKLSGAADGSSLGGATMSPTLSLAFTGAGVILGTAAYMSPEQARGKTVDKRADVWGFGCVLFEMLAGKRAFDGTDATEMIAAVVRGEPDWPALPEGTPPAVKALLRRCLEKDPRQRLRDMGDARYELDHALTPSPAVTASPTRPSWRSIVAWTSGALLLAAAAGVGAWLLKPEPARAISRFELQLSANEQFTFAGRHLVALSPQGHIAYAADNQIYLRLRDQLEATPIRGASVEVNQAPRNPFFSHDGEWLGFWADGQLKKVSISGGAPVTITSAQNPFGASWAADDTILFGQRGGVFRVSANGGTAERIIQAKPSQAVHGPQLLPDGRTVLLTLAASAGNWNDARIVAHSLDTGEQKVLVPGGTDARYLPTGHIVYSLNDSILAVSFDPARRTIAGGVVPLVEGVAQANAGQTGAAHFATNDAGTLLYVPETSVTGGGLKRTLVWVNRQGVEEPVKNLPVRTYRFLRFSHDGTRIALDVQDEDRDIWIWPFATGALTRLTQEATQEQYALWTPRDERIIFTSAQAGPANLYWQAANGTGKMERLTDSPNAQFPQAITPDGAQLIFRELTPEGGNLMIMPLHGERRVKPLIATSAQERNAELSPNGRWLAVESNDSGNRDDIFVRPFPDVEKGKWQISTAGGSRPAWASDSELLYVEVTASGDPSLMSVTVSESGGALQHLPPKKLFGLPALTRFTQGRAYDVSRDSRRFILAVKPVEASASASPSAPRLILVQNWFDEVKRRVSAK